MDLRGPARRSSSTTPWTYRFLRARANSIEGGTTEILKNIVAERVLGLPRMRDELRPHRRPADDQAHRARVPRRALHARGGPAAGARGRARLHRRAVGGDRRARLAGALVAEEHGGLGLGVVELAVVQEELGYALRADAAACRPSRPRRCIADAGSDEQRARWLPGAGARARRAATGARSLRRRLTA